jgi:hypothetical protein
MPVSALAVSPDGACLASVGHDGTLRFWDTAAGKARHSIQVSTDALHQVTFSPNGKTVASYGDDRMLRLWDAASGKQLRNWRAQGFGPLAFVARGTVIAMPWQRVVRLWAVDTGRPLPAIVGHRGFVRHIAASADGNALVSAAHGDSVLIWDADRVMHRHISDLVLEPRCWEFLWSGTAEEETAEDCLRLLAAYPAQTIQQIERRLAAAARVTVEATHLAQQLGEDSSEAREEAQRRLELLGADAVLPLNRAVAKPRNLEQRTRAKTLLNRLESAIPRLHRQRAKMDQLLHELARHPDQYFWSGQACTILRSPDFKTTIDRGNTPE